MRDLLFADQGFLGGYLFLIGVDYYCNVEDGAVKRGESEGPIPLGSKLGLLVSTPVARHTESTFLITYNETYSIKIANITSHKTQIGNFWKLNLLGIKENEPSV